jgi:hypothetical protein
MLNWIQNSFMQELTRTFAWHTVSPGELGLTVYSLYCMYNMPPQQTRSNVLIKKDHMVCTSYTLKHVLHYLHYFTLFYIVDLLRFVWSKFVVGNHTVNNGDPWTIGYVTTRHCSLHGVRYTLNVKRTWCCFSENVIRSGCSQVVSWLGSGLATEARY